jgi:hypothetical protein
VCRVGRARVCVRGAYRVLGRGLVTRKLPRGTPSERSGSILSRESKKNANFHTFHAKSFALFATSRCGGGGPAKQYYLATPVSRHQLSKAFCTTGVCVCACRCVAWLCCVCLDTHLWLPAGGGWCWWAPAVCSVVWWSWWWGCAPVAPPVCLCLWVPPLLLPLLPLLPLPLLLPGAPVSSLQLTPLVSHRSARLLVATHRSACGACRTLLQAGGDAPAGG